MKKKTPVPVLPLPPIEKAFIFTTAEPAAGIERGSFEMELHLDLKDYDNPYSVLNKTRKSIQAFYQDMLGDKVSVVFDYEFRDKPVKPLIVKCRKCRGKMKPSMALDNTTVGFPDFPGDTGKESHATLSKTGPAVMISCLKCEKCGHTISNTIV
jgi:hypothetical protein